MELVSTEEDNNGDKRVAVYVECDMIDQLRRRLFEAEAGNAELQAG
jgi:hypothetical protein